MSTAVKVNLLPPEGELFHLAGQYGEVQTPTDLAYTFRWERSDPHDRETVARLALHARRRNRGGAHSRPVRYRRAIELHKAGWTDTLARLASHLAPASPQSAPAPTIKPVTAVDAQTQPDQQWPCSTCGSL